MKSINLWSFVMTWIGCLCFGLASSMRLLPSGTFHYVVLTVSVLLFCCGFVGLGGARNALSYARSILTMLLCAALIVIEAVILSLGRLLS